MSRDKNYTEALIEFIDRTPNIYYAVKNTEELFLKHGFQQLHYEEEWILSQDTDYFINMKNQAIIAFKTGFGDIQNNGFRIIGTHGDSPCFKVKPKHMMKSNNYLKLSTECYGGPIISTWLDRPLGIAGKVILKSSDPIKPKEMLINIDKPLFIIPNLAVHINRGMNDGYKYNNQIDLQAVAGLLNDEMEEDNYLLNLICEEIQVDLSEILDFELFLYVYERSQLIGKEENFIAAPRLDDLWMVFTGAYGLIESKRNQSTNVFVCFDSEEVGSRTAEGANSMMLRNVLKRIGLALGKNEEQFLISLNRSVCVSADLAHGVHPNLSEKMDPLNFPLLGKGPVIKYAANQSYATNALSASVFKTACDVAGVPFQVYTNRSDSPGGSTIGPITSAFLNMSTVDVGSAILSMHSAKELGEINDNVFMIHAMKAFYEI